MQHKHFQPNKIVPYVFLLVLLAQVISAILNLQLFQDGASYLFEILQTKKAAIRHHRISAALVQLPTLFLIKVLGKFFGGINQNLSIIRIAFSLSYAFVPVLALGLSWMIVRKRNEALFIWPCLIILFINLVNFSGVSELLMALQLSCPLMLGAVTIPKTRFFLIIAAFLLPVIFFLHPLVVLLFFTMAVGLFYAGYKNSDIRQRAWRFTIVFLFIAILKFIVNTFWLTDYESNFLASRERNEYLFQTSFENIILLFSALLIGAGCLLMKFKSNFKVMKPLSLKRSYLVYIMLAVTSGLVLVSQYSYREFPLKTGLAVFASLAILLLMAVDSIYRTEQFESIYRFRLTFTLAIIFSLVIIIKSLIWQSSIEKLRESIAKAAGVCMESNSENFQWLKTSPYKIINTWALPSLALIEQNGASRKLLLETGNCKTFYESGLIRIDEWTVLPKEFIAPALR